MVTSVHVAYKQVDGWHVFSSEKMPGLYVASKNAAKAFNDVAKAIEMLVELNANAKCKAVPEMTFSEFLRKRRVEPAHLKATRGRAKRTAPSRRPLTMTDQRFALQACA
ncbi:MAG TPA: hypothetical protein VM074_01810 [Solimonas sp.]|nr:hypothetical protein [Solimonas sp.]